MSQPKIDKSQLDVGLGANQLVQLDGSGRLPAVDESLLTGLNATPSDQPKFMSYLTTNKAMNTGTSYVWNTANFSLTYDSIGTSGWTPSTGEFQPNTAGHYYFGYQLDAQGVSTTPIFTIIIRKNGSQFSSITTPSTNGAITIRHSSGSLVYLNGTTDVVTVTISVNQADWTLRGSSAPYLTHFYGFRVL